MAAPTRANAESTPTGWKSNLSRHYAQKKGTGYREHLAHDHRTLRAGGDPPRDRAESEGRGRELTGVRDGRVAAGGGHGVAVGVLGTGLRMTGGKRGVCP
jgi:hypothetical protein